MTVQCPHPATRPSTQAGCQPERPLRHSLRGTPVVIGTSENAGQVVLGLMVPVFALTYGVSALAKTVRDRRRWPATAIRVSDSPPAW